MIRVTGGKLRGRPIESPPRAAAIRPTTSLVRESVFSRLQNQIADCRFLDLFAGSGIMGIEAISRNARFVLAVEQDVRQCKLIRKNLETLGITESQLKIIPYKVEELLAKTCREEAFDIIFMDPPYGLETLPELIRLCRENDWLKPDGVLLIEHGVRDPDLEGFNRKNYGDSSLSVSVPTA